MIVPRSRLVLWSALVLLPFGTVLGMDTAARPYAGAALGAFAVLALLDAALTPRRLRGLSVELPVAARATRDRDAKLLVRIHNPRQDARTVRLTLDLPPALRPAVDEMLVELPGGSGCGEFEWPLHPVERGRFGVTAARVEAVSPLGFWAWWKTLPVAGEVRVYPNLLGERKNLAALFLNRGGVGVHAQRMVGKGRDFEKLREYIPGDSYDEVHWKATAKRGRPVTKIFQIERTQEIYVIVDASRLSARKVSNPAVRVPGSDRATASQPDAQNPEPETTTLDRFLTAALVLGLAAENQGDLFGLITFSDKVETFLRARNGKAHYHACRDALYTLQPREVTPDFDELSTFIRLRLRRRALLFFLTSLDDPVLAEGFTKSMNLLCRQHLILVNMIQPPGARPLFSDTDAASTAALYEQLGGHTRWHNLRELEKILQRRGVRLTLLESEGLAADLVSQYINIKQRQIL
jgi:uncharacterized protein (DUF58 family)